ncbi:hypothetical protein CYMTET_14681 [Cymbomonas tetramitiformis]|uniref:Uncharacterized protein n=1 Tax=Cymbomonas tetramitiformis TaxID=36881 RepID=A0AAE0L9S6_9CHLO|nr:hypothetical protein CYMTET_14681 [Cymbomonas tetramitiformis]
MGLDTGTLSGGKRSHPTAETLDTTSPSKRKQVNVKQAKGTSVSSAVKHSLATVPASGMHVCSLRLRHSYSSGGGRIDAEQGPRPGADGEKTDAHQTHILIS